MPACFHGLPAKILCASKCVAPLRCSPRCFYVQPSMHLYLHTASIHLQQAQIMSNHSAMEDTGSLQVRCKCKEGYCQIAKSRKDSPLSPANLSPLLASGHMAGALPISLPMGYCQRNPSYLDKQQCSQCTRVLVQVHVRQILCRSAEKRNNDRRHQSID